MVRALRIIWICLSVIWIFPSQAGAREELRGLYMELTDSQGHGVFPLVPDGDWQLLCRKLKALGLNAIFPYVVSPAGSAYPSDVVKPLPKDSLLGQPNLLKTIITAAHAEGLEVHPWTIEWYNAPQGADPDRLVHDASGNTTNSLCPSVIANRDLMRRMIMELVTDFDIDGIHYDYMRFPEGGYCYCRHCRAGFEKTHGVHVDKWPADVLQGGKLEASYIDYLYGTLNSFVRDMYSLIKKTKPKLAVSSAVWCSETDSRLVGVRQDWGKWVREGWLDFVAPMNYGNNWIIQHYDDFARNEAKQVAGKMPLIFALGATMDTSEGLENAVNIGRELKGDGFIIYTLTSRIYGVHLPALYRTVWSQPATVPEFGGKKHKHDPKSY